MPDWQSPIELQKEGVVFGKFMHSLLGLYAYEWLISLNFELDFLRGKKRFRWPMIFYFANRYLLLFALIGIAVSLNVTEQINCQAIFTFNQIAGDAAVGLASINLSIRTMAIWAQNRYIVCFLILVILGHWSLILQGIQLKAIWVEGAGCVITATNNRILAAIFIYSMCFDLIVLLLNTYKLAGLREPTDRILGRSRLAQLIFTDGLIYFIIAFIANLLATVFMLLDLNQIMSVIFNVPAAVFCTIVACRAVRRLNSFTHNGADVYTSSQSGQINFRGPPPTIAARALPSSRHGGKCGSGPQSGVHVQMETFTRAEEGGDNDIYGCEAKRNRDGSETDVEVDLEAKGAL